MAITVFKFSVNNSKVRLFIFTRKSLISHNKDLHKFMSQFTPPFQKKQNTCDSKIKNN